MSVPSAPPPGRVLAPGMGKPSQPAAAKPVGKFSRTKGVKESARIMMLYGTGGVGKTTLASFIPNVLLFAVEPGSDELNVDRIEDLNTWEDLLAAFGDDSLFDGVPAICIDSITRVEMLATEHVLRTVRTREQKVATSLEDYGYGDGYGHVYQRMRDFMQRVEQIKKKGIHVVLIAHQTVAEIVNTEGANYQQLVPRLQCPPKGKADVRSMVIEACDEVLLIKYDVDVKKGKGDGSGSRTIYTQELPAFIAKSRKTAETFPYDKGSDNIWKSLGVIK